MLWPGEDRIDKKRFVELLVKFSDSELNASRSSLPLLTWSLEDNGRSQEVKLLESSFPKLKNWTCEVLTGDDIDEFEDKIKVVLGIFR